MDLGYYLGIWILREAGPSRARGTRNGAYLLSYMLPLEINKFESLLLSEEESSGSLIWRSEMNPNQEEKILYKEKKK